MDIDDDFGGDEVELSGGGAWGWRIR